MFDYFPGHSLLHRLDVRSKSLAFLSVTIVAFLFSEPVFNLVLATIVLLMARAAGISWQRINAKIRPLMPILLAVVLAASISYPATRFATPAARHTLWAFPPYFALTTGGLLYGVTLLLRILVMVLSSSVLLYCTPVEDFLQLMQKLRVPYQLSFVLATAIRFVPTMERKMAHILDAQRARGGEVGSGKLAGWFLSYLPVMVPLMVGALRMSDELAMAMLNRGYGARPRATPMKDLAFGATDYLVCAICVAILAAAILLSHAALGRL